MNIGKPPDANEKYKTLLCLVGDQPMPNLLPILHCCPERVILIHSQNSEYAAENLKAALKPELSEVCSFYKIDAYSLESVTNGIASAITNAPPPVCFNITSGSKPMSIAAYDCARSRGEQVMYVTTRGGATTMHMYAFLEGTRVLQNCINIATLLTLPQYLTAHGFADHKSNPANEPFEQGVCRSLRGIVDDLIPGVRPHGRIGNSLEIDALLRRGNDVAIAEIKRGTKAGAKRGIDQLVAASAPDKFGLFTHRLLIVDRPLESDNKMLAEAHRIHVTVLSGRLEVDGALPQDDATLLARDLDAALPRAPLSQ